MVGPLCVLVALELFLAAAQPLAARTAVTQPGQELVAASIAELCVLARIGLGRGSAVEPLAGEEPEEFTERVGAAIGALAGATARR